MCLESPEDAGVCRGAQGALRCPRALCVRLSGVLHLLHPIILTGSSSSVAVLGLDASHVSVTRHTGAIPALPAPGVQDVGSSCSGPEQTWVPHFPLKEQGTPLGKERQVLRSLLKAHTAHSIQLLFRINTRTPLLLSQG